MHYVGERNGLLVLEEGKMNRVSGKIAIVTGAASGIGKATALTLSSEGASVVITDIDEIHGRLTSVGGQLNALENSQLSTFENSHSTDLTLSAV